MRLFTNMERDKVSVVHVEQAEEKKKQEHGNIPIAQDETHIVLNVGGQLHETTIGTLLSKPETRLYHVAIAAKRCGLREVFFDRNPAFFCYVINYYRTGMLHLPTNVCTPMVKEELDFWKVDEKEIEQCCWVKYISHENTMELMRHFEEDDPLKYKQCVTNDAEKATSWCRIKPKVWRWLYDSYSSTNALVYSVFSLLVMGISIVVFIIETLPYFNATTTHAIKSNLTLTSDDLRKEMNIFSGSGPYHTLLMIDNICNLFFFLEFTMKLATVPYRCRFLRMPLTIVEMSCLVPYYVANVIVFVHHDPIVLFDFIRVLLAFRVLRIFRLFALMKHFLALKILVYTMIGSAKELLLLIMIVLIGMIIFSCLEYYMEMFSSEQSDFEHIPLTFWWALVTMTTVGYGDMYPKSGLGYIVGAVCAISGVLVIALSVPVIVNNFTVYYTHAQSRAKLRQRRKAGDVKTKCPTVDEGRSMGIVSKLRCANMNQVKDSLMTCVETHGQSVLDGNEHAVHTSWRKRTSLPAIIKVKS